MFVPSPTCAAISLPMATWSPVTIFTRTPISLAVAIVAFESSRGGSESGSTPRNCQWSCSSVRATPSERKPRAANSLTAFSTSASTRPAFAASFKMTWGAPLVTFDCLPSAVFRVASVRLPTGSNGWKCSIWQAFSDSLSFSPLSTAWSMASAASARDASAPKKMTSSGLTPRTQNGSPSLSLFCVKRAGLVGTEHVHAGEFFDGDQTADDGLFPGEQARAHRHGDGQHRGHGHRNRGHRQHQRELEGGDKLVATKHGHTQ